MIVWLVSYPRSGNTFTRIVCESVFPISDTYTIHHEDPTDRSLLDRIGAEGKDNYDYVDIARNLEEVFFVKSHRLFDELVDVKKDKVIYIVRDGRASTSSYLHFIKNFTKSKKGLRDIIKGNVNFGSWSDHVRSWNSAGISNNLLIIKYEQIVLDPLKTAENISRFIGMKMLNSRVPSFDELHALRPNFFRSGNNEKWVVDFTILNYILFLRKSSKVMRESGYEVLGLVSELARFISKRRKTLHFQSDLQ